ncbi:MAG: hypothetical protein MI757_03310 [Pirellulales bacterium]|nr:hypothetical protein [Pirellulales bacterium]
MFEEQIQQLRQALDIGLHVYWQVDRVLRRIESINNKECNGEWLATLHSYATVDLYNVGPNEVLIFTPPITLPAEPE